jgi:gamma-glutamyl-gamma-aminobutyrate hydrolase PuuD
MEMQIDGIKKVPTIGIMPVPKIRTNTRDVIKLLDNNFIDIFEKHSVNYLVIPYNMAKSKLNALLPSLDGLIFPGGHLGDLYNNKLYKDYYITQKFLVKKAKEINSLYRPFPVLGICNGYENMILIEKNYNITRKNIKRTFIKVEAYKNYKTRPTFSKNKLSKAKIIIHNNMLAVDPAQNIDGYIMYAKSLDKNNKEFIEIIKHKKYPFYGFQGHVEVSSKDLLDSFIKYVKISFSKNKRIITK